MWYLLLFLFLMAAAEVLSENPWLLLIAIVIAVLFFICKNRRNKVITPQCPIQNTQSPSVYLNSNNDNLDGHQFETYCAELLKRNNFFHVFVTKGSGDFGVDILAEKDGWKYAIQCKNYSAKVGNHAVQEVYSGKDYYNADIAVVMTNNFFTPAAIETADSLNVELWDRDKLNSMINPHSVANTPSLIPQKTEPEISERTKRKLEEHRQKELALQKSPSQESILYSQTDTKPKTIETKETEMAAMYDEEKGIYPSGEYLVGEDIPLGKYLLKQRDGSTNGEIHIYKDYQAYLKNPDNELIFKMFKGDYHLSLRTEGNLLVVENADMQKL